MRAREAETTKGRHFRRNAFQVIQVLLLLFLACVVRVAWYEDLRRQPDFRAPLHDAAFKDWWGRAIVTGDYSMPEGQRSPFIENWPLPNPPAYSWFLAGLYRLSGERLSVYYEWIRYAQCAFGLTTVLLLYALGRRLFSHVVGLLAGGLYAFQWAVVYYEGEINQPAMTNLIVVVMALLCLEWLRRGSVWYPALLGVLWGGMVLLRPESLLFLPVIPLWMTWSGYSRWRWRALSAAVITVLAAVATMAPVTFPHYPGSRSWFTVSYGGEVSFYLSNNEHADGVRPDTPDLYAYVPRNEWNIFNWGELYYRYCTAHFGRLLAYHEFRAHFMQRGWDFIKSHPGLTLGRGVRKLLLFWGPAIVDENKVVALERERSDLLRILPDFPVLVATTLLAMLLVAGRITGLAGASRAPGMKALALGRVNESAALMALLGVFAAVTCATFLLFIVNARYRMPVYPALSLGGAWGIVELVRLGRVAGTRRRVLLAGLFLGIYLLTRVDWVGFSPNSSRWHDERRRAWLASGMASAGIADLARWLKNHPNDVAGFYNLGILLFETGQVEQAEQAFTRAVEVDADFSPAWYNLGLARLARGDGRGAVEALERRVTVEKEDGDAWYALARARRLLNDVAGEESALRETIRIQPDHAGALNDLGALLSRTRRPGEAVEVLRTAVTCRPDDRDIRFNLARALMRWGDAKEAAALFRALLSAQETPDLWRNLGFALAAAGEDEEAVDAFQHALAGNVKDPEILSAMGVSLDRVGDSIAAEMALKEALSHDADCAVCWLNLGQVMERRGRIGTAIRAYETALAHDPDLDGALLALGLIAWHQGKDAEAMTLFTRAVEANPANGYAWYNKAMLSRGAGKLEDAWEALRQATRCRNVPADAWRSLALLSRELGHNEEAVEAFGEALKRYPRDADLYFGLGATLLDTGQLAGAREALDRATAMAPWDGEAWNLLGLVARRSGDHALGTDAFLRAWRRLPGARRPDALRMRALSLLDGGRCADAAVILEDLTGDLPFGEDAGAWYDLARSLGCAGRDEAAFRACEEALRRNGGHVPALLLQAELLRKRGDPAGAEARLRAALDQDGANADALFNMGLLAREAGKEEEAIQWFQKALESASDRADTHLNLGLALEAVGRRDEAEACYRRAVSLDGGLALARLKLADRLRETGKEDEALEHYAAARRLDPTNPDAPKNQGYLLLKRGDAAAAEEAFREARRIRPDDPDTLLGLADALARMRPADTAEAEELYRRAATLRQDDPRPWKNLGFLLARAGRLGEAAEAFRQVLDRDPADADVACGLADALFAMGHNDEAESLYRRALALRPDFALALNNYGDLLTRTGRHEGALDCYRRAHELTPDNPSVLFNLGRALQRKGQLAEAIPLLERVVTLRSEDARARLILAQALAEAGRTDEARIHARRVALERPDWEQARQLLETLDKAPTASGPDRKGP